MDAGPRDGDGPDHDAGPPRRHASDRLQLEIALLAAGTESSDDGIAADEPSRTVLLAVGDADLREYIRQCLRQRADLRVVEPQPGDDPLTVGRRQPVALVIADGSPDGAAPVNRPPLLLIGDEPCEALPVRDGAGMAFLLQPFNARKLLDVVASLLGQASG